MDMDRMDYALMKFLKSNSCVGFFNGMTAQEIMDKLGSRRSTTYRKLIRLIGQGYVALLMKAAGENPLEEGIFEVEEDAIQCYTERFPAEEHLAAFRSPHNSPNNILHFHNIKSEKISKYFPNLGQNIIIINLIGTNAQARGSGFDEDSDFVFVTNQTEITELARKSYVEYPTIINAVDELKSSEYHFRLEDYAVMDSKIADAQAAIGMSTDGRCC